MNKATTRKIKKTEPGLKTRLAEKTFQLKVESAFDQGHLSGNENETAG